MSNGEYHRIFLAVLAAVLSATVLTGCATKPGGTDNDPCEPFNREMFDVNMALDKSVMRPVAKGYNRVVPELARTGMHNIIVNLNEPVVFANLLLQGRGEDAGSALARFALDSSVGMGGLIDVGTRVGLPAKDTDFGVTLGVWGFDEGGYLVLPLLGPAPPRDLAGRAVDTLLDPVTYFDFRSKFYYQGGRAVLQIVDLRARNIDTLDEIERNSIDFYAATRSFYLQYRAAQVRSSVSAPTDAPAPAN